MVTPSLRQPCKKIAPMTKERSNMPIECEPLFDLTDFVGVVLRAIPVLFSIPVILINQITDIIAATEATV